MSNYIGDFNTGVTITFPIQTRAKTGAAVAPNSALEAADLVVYKNASATQRTSANGITMTSPFDSITGGHMVAIDLTDNTDAGFWATGNDYHVWLVPDETVDSETIRELVAHFSLENRNIKANVTSHLGTACPTPITAGVPTSNPQTAPLKFTAASGTANSFVTPTVAAGSIAPGDAVYVSNGASKGSPNVVDTVSGTTVITATMVQDFFFGAVSDTSEIIVIKDGGVVPVQVSTVLQDPAFVALVAAVQALQTEMGPAGAGLTDAPYLKPTVAGRTLDVSATGEAGVDWANIGSPTTTLNLSGTTVKTATDVEADTQDLQARTPAALVSGRMNASVGAMAAAVLDAAAIAANAFAAAKFATDYSTAVQALVDAALAARGITTTRTAYLDKLNISGNVASSSEVTAIQNNTRVVRVVPAVIERPDSGTVTYRVELLLYDETGNMEAPDSAPTIALVNQSGTDRSARLDSTTMANVSTGRYRAIYTASSADTLEQLVWTFSVVEGSATRLFGNDSLIVDTTAVDFTAADRTKLDTLHDTRLTSARASLLDKLNITGDVAGATPLATLQTSVNTVAGYVDTEVAQIVGLLDTEISSILNALTANRGEPGQGAPGVSISAVEKLDYLYKFMRNKITQDASQFAVYADNGSTIDHKATVSSDGTTLTRGELATGP